MTPGTIFTKMERHRSSSLFPRGRDSLHSGATFVLTTSYRHGSYLCRLPTEG